MCGDDDKLLEEMLPAKNCDHKEIICLTCFDKYVSVEMKNKGGGNISEI